MNGCLPIKVHAIVFLLVLFPAIPFLVGAVVTADQIDDATRLTTKGFDLYKAGRYRDALASFDSAIAIDPYSSLSWYGKGLASAALNDKAGAIGALDRATELSPKDEQSWLKKGEIYRSMNRNDLSIDAYKRALLINPNSMEAKQNLESLGIQATPTTVDYSQYPVAGLQTPTPRKLLPSLQPAVIVLVVGMIFVALWTTGKKSGN